MDTKKLLIDDIRGFELARLNEIEEEVRLELINVRMDIFQASAKHVGTIRGLKKTLARVLTVQSEKKVTKEA